MTTINKNNYYVVKFKDLPYDNIEKYVIIPYTWIRTLRPSGTIQVAFPKEDPKKTRRRVEKNQKHGLNWQLYKAIVKFDSSNFNDADTWISTMKNEQPEIQSAVIVEKKKNYSLDVSKNVGMKVNNDALTTNEDSTTKANKNILLLPKKRYRNIDVEKTFSTSKVNKPEMKIKPLKSDKTELITNSRKRKMGLDSTIEFLRKEANIANSVKSAEDGSNCLNTSYVIPTDNKSSSNKQNFDCQQQQQQRHSTQSIVIKSLTSGENHRENPRSTTSPVQCNPKIEDQTSCRSNQPAGSSERFHIHKVIQNTPPLVQNLPNHSNKSLNFKPILRGLLLEEPISGTLFLRKLNNFPIPKQVTAQDTAVNSSSSEQGLPPTKCTSASCYTDYILPKESVEKRFPEKPSITITPVSTSRNILYCQKNPISHCQCSSKCIVRKRASSPTPDQSCEPVPKKQFSDASDNFSGQEIFTKDVPVKKLNPNHDKSSNGFECIPQHVLTTKNNFPITTKISIESKEMTEKILMNEFDTMLKEIDTIIDNRDEPLLIVRNAMYEYFQTFKNLVGNVNSYCELRIKEVKSIEKPQTQPAVSSSPEDTTATRGNNQQNSNNDNHDDEADKIAKKPHSFTLPPDYDPSDTRWTLKYREPGSGIVELIPHSNVYIKAHRLAYCKREARDCKTLARMLLMEIFSLSALSVCSLTGTRARAFDLDGSDIRPGLDEHARSVLLTFVEMYGIKNRWSVFDTQSILNSIRNEIQEIRSKHGSIIQ